MATLVNHRYQLVRALGSGQHGAVWLAEDLNSGRAPRALKFVTQEGKSQLLTEFEQLACLHHVGLARVFAIEEVTHLETKGPAEVLAENHEDLQFIVSEFIGGTETLVLAQATQPADLADMLLSVAEQLASALSHLHARSWVHADIKPDNMRWADAERLVLLDLGLTRHSGKADVRGTLRYMAPEALSGYLDARSDLYSVGATLFELAGGLPLFVTEDRAALVAEILSGSSQGSLALRLPAQLPESVIALIATLLATDPSERPSGAMALMAHVARIRESTGNPGSGTHRSASPYFSRPEFAGRTQELQQLRAALRSFGAAPAAPRRIVIAGPKGSGRRRLVEEALLQYQMEHARAAQAALPALLGTREELWPRRVEIAARGPAFIGIYDDGDPSLAELVTAELPPGILLILCLGNDVFAPTSLVDQTIALRPLLSKESASLCQGLALQRLDAAYCERAHQLTQGWPGPIRDLMSAAATLDPAYRRSPDALLREPDLQANLVQRISSLGARPGQVLEALAVTEQTLDLRQLAALLKMPAQELHDAVAELIASGFVNLQSGRICCLSTEQARAIEEQLPSARRRALHRRCLQHPAHALAPMDRARHLMVAGPANEANRAVMEAIVDRRQAGRLDQALQLCLSSAENMSGKASSEHAAQTAEIALASGSYQVARDFALRAKRSRDLGIRERGLRALARSSQHLGNSQEAEQYFKELLSNNPGEAETRARLAKTLLQQGDLSAARDQAMRALEDASVLAVQALALEVLGLARLYAGQVEGAAEIFSDLAARSQASGDLAVLGRARGLQGMCAQKQGKLSEAAARYGEAHAHSMASGAWHSASVFLLNRATVEQRAAHYALALDSLSAALPGLQHSGTPFELAAAHCNRGNLLLILGELSAARSEANRASELAQSAAEPRIQFFIYLLEGDIASRDSQQGKARECFEAALDLAERHALADSLHAELRLREMRAAAGEATSSDLIYGQQGDSHEQQVEALATQARVQLQVGAPSAELAEELGRLSESLCSSDDLDLGWRVCVLHAQTRYALDQGQLADRATVEAKRVFDTVVARSPEAYRKGLHQHPDAQNLAGLLARADRVSKTTASSDDFPTRSLLGLSRRLNSELRLEPLLDDIIDTAIELSRAERAFLLLQDPSGQLDVRVARNIDREDLGSDARLSRSIAERVAQTGQAVMTVDAESDARFGTSHSVAALRLRSILAVPFRVKSRVVGTLYLDHRFRRGAFSESAIEVVRELADIAAVAIENARLVRSLEDVEAQLATAKAQLPTLRPRHGFGTIVGDSDALRAVLTTAERAAASDLSVVIAGESGTGKELLARAIHSGSKRCEQPFVALNCGAVPDSLLESELFGHRKGAFTGADRGRRGLFQVADGGTLFLDEIADTSLAMQSKLLRALQDGEIRPVGAEETTHVDVRIICASNRELASLVQAGLFREDLFYRLHVMSLTLPPLRERIADIKPLARHILDKLDHAKGLSPSALSMLQSHRWPGNVRELENELTRACAIADGDMVQPHHLSESLQQLQDLRSPLSQDKLLLKPRVERLERSLVEEAMRQTEGNQSRAAVLLGLSRFGLQKKLLRYGIAGSQRTPGTQR